MPAPDPESVGILLTNFIKAIQVGLVTSVGGAAGHIIDVVLNKKPWSLKVHLALALVAFIVGQVIGDTLPTWVEGKYGVMMMLGTISYPIYIRLQEKYLKRAEETA